MLAAATDVAGDARAARRSRVAGVYAVTPDQDDTDDLVARVEAAIRGGAAAMQYRTKAADAALREAQARALVRACEGRALLIVNDDAALAARVAADGVHLGEDDGAIDDARRRLPSDAIVGVSCYGDASRARDAAAQGADYVAFGSFFPSRVKPGARQAKVELLAHARTLGVPVVAIGGITAANAAALVTAGADAVAVISDVFAHATHAGVERATRRLVDVVAAARTPRRNSP
jgi:thiamine-phosphate pyrophosphorylase